MKSSHKNGFTLIELLIVVAPVAIIVYGGTIYHSMNILNRVPEAEMIHERVNAVIAASLTQCATGQIVKLPGYTNVDCRSGRKYSAAHWRDLFITYFSRAGFKNPYSPNENAVFSCSTSSTGRTCLQASGFNIYIRTYPGDANGNRGTLITSRTVIE